MTRVVSCQNCDVAQCIEYNLHCSECGKPIEDSYLGTNPWNNEEPQWKCSNCKQRGKGEAPAVCPDCKTASTREITW